MTQASAKQLIIPSLNHGGPRPGSGRPRNEIPTVMVKAYPTSEQSDLIKAEATRLDISISQYLVRSALANLGK